ncbi:PaaI family thioesterase [Wenyingzhuangia sp. 2_MG-2023]|uniref:PaaI family thioesterase n=1 Tax=Wenyingzhuangia sp. 2_MG-2023 TaxID=3062639 RepID=UPI0026E37946|nr:PaaI family thioesterase [Wenyingzhuangia sp. 2_MG-2023]MDO6738243.1 PaaI family thioesterase [Wenyingzhuangia sp. 2_MG-2023]
MDFKKALEQVNKFSKNTLMETLGIEYTEIGSDYLVATMPVTSKVHQPMGLLHGGATVALAESVGSAASFLFIDPEKFIVKGIEISANHLKSKRQGLVTAKATCVHRGKTTHLWQVAITDEEGVLISLCKITNIVLSK